MEILGVMNAWAEADLEHIRATHAELSAQVLHRMPPVIPPRMPSVDTRGAAFRSGRRAMRQKSEPHPEGWGHGQQWE